MLNLPNALFACSLDTLPISDIANLVVASRGARDRVQRYLLDTLVESAPRLDQWIGDMPLAVSSKTIKSLQAFMYCRSLRSISLYLVDESDESGVVADFSSVLLLRQCSNTLQRLHLVICQRYYADVLQCAQELPRLSELHMYVLRSNHTRDNKKKKTNTNQTEKKGR